MEIQAYSWKTRNHKMIIIKIIQVKVIGYIVSERAPKRTHVLQIYVFGPYFVEYLHMQIFVTRVCRVRQISRVKMRNEF